MLKIEKTVLPSPEQWEIIIEGMRNPMNSWDKMDSEFDVDWIDDSIWPHIEGNDAVVLGENDHKLMMQLAKGGAVHAKYRRMIPVFLTITAPFYWWKEFDTYKVGTVCNSCSTMHKIHAKPFEITDFSFDHNEVPGWLEHTIRILNACRDAFLVNKDKKWWYSMVQILPTSYNQKRTIMLNYEVLVNIYHSRKNHKLEEWHVFCDWIKTLPYSELITGGDDDV